MPVIGYLRFASPASQSQFLDALRQGLTEAGYIEGQNVAIEYRWSEDNYDRLSPLATDLCQRKVDVIVAVSGPSAHAAKSASSVILIVFMTRPGSRRGTGRHSASFRAVPNIAEW
jgi:putative ABC transport system substrate-binding protein